MSKEDFKKFVSSNPSLAKHVNNGSMSWQKFYEMHSLYGDNNDVWKDYLTTATTTTTNTNTTNTTTTTTNTTNNNDDLRSDSSGLSSSERAVKELIGMVKGMDLEKVRGGIEGVQKAIGLVQEMGFGSKGAETAYQARPHYQHFDD